VKRHGLAAGPGDNDAGISPVPRPKRRSAISKTAVEADLKPTFSSEDGRASLIRRASIDGTAILEKPVSDLGTLEDLSQSAESATLSDRKLLILNVEMLERSIRHAWKSDRFARADAHRISPTHSRSTTSRNIDTRRHVLVNHRVDRGFRGVCDTVLTQSSRQ